MNKKGENMKTKLLSFISIAVLASFLSIGCKNNNTNPSDTQDPGLGRYKGTWIFKGTVASEGQPEESIEQTYIINEDGTISLNGLKIEKDKI